jgi:putative MATE family efflux protein
MLAQLFGALVNIILDPILIFGMFGLPEMGIRGAAIATVCGQWTAAVLGFLLHIIQNKEIHFEWKGFRFEWNIVGMIYRVGAPTILTQAIGSVMVAAMNRILGSFTSVAVTFFGVYYKLQSFLFMPMNGLGQGTLPIVGFNYGAKNPGRIRAAAKVSLVSGACIGLVGTAVFLLFPKALLGIFSASPEMLALGVPALRTIAVIFALSSVTMITGYLISGLGNGTVNMVATAIRQIVVLLPMVALLGHMFGVERVWFAFWISEAVAAVYALYELRRHFRKLEE